jgi:glucosamine-6-phosphate deaminase
MVAVHVLAERQEIGRIAAETGAKAIKAAIAEHGEATIVVATGASQFDTLAVLTATPGIDWTRVAAFHLDEYVGLPETDRASFRRYLRERFVEPLGGKVAFIPVDGEADPAGETERLSNLIRGRRIDVCFAGIGENCHLAFNDPPADFETEQPYITVTLDEACRRQQWNEGWFPSLEAVPRQAISMSIRQMMRSRLIVLSVPDERKALAVRDAVEGPVSPDHPASILQTHPNALLLLDPPAASLLTAETP